MGPLIYLNEEKKYTLSLGLQLSGELRRAVAPSHGGFRAGADACRNRLLFGQKHILEGIATTGIKG